MQLSYLYVSDFPFKNHSIIRAKTFVNSLNMQKQYEKNVWEKGIDPYSW